MSPASISLHGDALAAIVTMAVAVAIAFVVDRLVVGRGGRSRGRGERLMAERRLRRGAAAGGYPFLAS